MSLKILFLALAALFVTLSVTLDNWPAKVGVTGDQGIIAIFAMEAAILIALIATIRRRRKA